MLELNPELQALLLAGVTYLVTQGLKSFGALVGFDLSGAAAAITAGLMGIVLAILSGLLGIIPAEYHEIANIIMALLVGILGSFGIHKTVKDSRA